MDEMEKIDPSSYREIEQICAEIAQLQSRLAALLAEQRFQGQGAQNIQSALEQVLKEARERAEKSSQLALTRVNFRDNKYRFLRAIDGDTIEVAPPGELRDWMHDVHIRLYGMDTPERGEERAAFYTSLLGSLCLIDGGAISVVWERERRSTEYAGFPLSSFERGIGNVFVDIPGDEEYVLYVNAFLASFPDVKLVRDDKPLLRGARVFRFLEEEDWPHWPWHRHWWPHHLGFWAGFRRFPLDLPSDPAEIRELVWTLSSHYPRCIPWVLPRKIFAERKDQSLAIRDEVARPLRTCGCRACNRVADFLESELPAHLEKESASIYDVLLLLARAPHG